MFINIMFALTESVGHRQHEENNITFNVYFIEASFAGNSFVFIYSNKIGGVEDLSQFLAISMFWPRITKIRRLGMRCGREA